MAQQANNQFVLTKYANNESIDDSFFAYKDADFPAEPADDEIQIELVYLSVDPYMRGRMNDTKSYFPGFELNKPMNGGCVGKILKSKSDKYPVGKSVGGMFAWVKFQNVKISPAVNVLPDQIKSSYFLGSLGMPGNSALLSMKNIWLTSDEIKNNKNTVFVSGAAGAVGSTVGQICKSYGYTVIGSAGSDEKIQYLKEIGFDHTFNYKTDKTNDKLKEFAPEGLNMYFDNVGGETLDDALNNMAAKGTIICCGSISGYDIPSEQRYGNKNLGNVIVKSLKMQGFIASDYMAQFGEGTKELIGLLSTGKLKIRETTVKGLDKAGEAFIGVLKGKNIGKMIVEI